MDMSCICVQASNVAITGIIREGNCEAMIFVVAGQCIIKGSKVT